MVLATMSCTTHCVRPFVFIHWTRPELPDLAPLEQTVQRLFREFGEPVVSVSILDERTTPPEAEVRSELVAQTRRMSEMVRTYYTVVGGKGFRATVQRSVLAGMFLVHRGPVRPIVTASIDEVLDREAGTYALPRAQVLRQLRERELIID